MRASLLLAVAACSVAQAAPHATVELLPRAEVSGNSVTLGHIARLNSDDLVLMRRLVDLPVGRAPAAGQAAWIQRTDLEAWVGRRLAGAQVLQWRGAEQAQVSRVVRELDPDEVSRAALQAGRAWLARRGVEGDIELRHAIRTLPVPAGEVRLQVRSLEHVQLGPRILVWVDAWAGEQFVRSVPVSLAVTWTEPPLSPQAGRDASRPGGVGLRPMTPAAGPAAGPALVQRGEWASLRSVAGAVRLESRVEVLQDGRRGQKVRVRQPGAGGLVFARVVAPGELELAP